MNTAFLLQLHENLKSLTLGNAARHLEERLRQAAERGSSYEEFLLELTNLELRIRSENREKRRLKEARFPLVKTLATFTFEEAPQLDRRRVGELAAGDYTTRRRNVLFLGKSGCGKTHLATALGIENCRQNLQVRFFHGLQSRQRTSGKPGGKDACPYSGQVHPVRPAHSGRTGLRSLFEGRRRAAVPGLRGTARARIGHRDDEPRIRQLDRGLRRSELDGGPARPTDPQGAHHRGALESYRLKETLREGRKRGQILLKIADEEE